MATGMVSDSVIKRRHQKDDAQQTLMLLKEVERIESPIKLTSLLIDLKSDSNTYFKSLLRFFEHLQSKPERRQGISVILEHWNKFHTSQASDKMFIYLIEATFTVDFVNQNTKQYGHCLKMLEAKYRDFNFHDAQHVKFWLARHKSMYYMSKNECTHKAKVKAACGDIEEFYRSGTTKPDMWKAMACQQLCKQKLYEHYKSSATIKRFKQVSEGNCGQESFTGSQTSTDAIELLEDECRFALHDPEHEKYVRCFDFLWPHVQKCLVSLNIPLGFQMRLWKNMFPIPSQMRYNDIPDHFKKFFEQPTSQLDLAKCESYLTTLRHFSECKNTPYHVDREYLPRMMAMIRIGLEVRRFHVRSSSLLLILSMMIKFIERFLVVRPFLLMEYTYARPETIFPVFLGFINTVIRHISDAAETGQSLHVLLTKAFQPLELEDCHMYFVKFKSCIATCHEMQFTDTNLFQFCDHLKWFCDVEQRDVGVEGSQGSNGLSDLDVQQSSTEQSDLKM